MVGEVQQSSWRQKPAAGSPGISMPGTQLISSFPFFIHSGTPAYMVVPPVLSVGPPARLNLSGNVLKGTFTGVSPR